MNRQNINPVTYDQALKLVLEHAENFRTATEFIALHKSLNRVLASDIHSDLDLPGADNSSMDGYCLSADAVAGATREQPISLPVVSGIDAGHTISDLPTGHCAYIATGGLLPPGADTVIRLEDTCMASDGRTVTFFASAKPGKFVRPRASEICKGQLLVKSGTLITPHTAGQIASSGQMQVKVLKRPTIAIITSGDEVLMPWETPEPWQVRNSNTIMLSLQSEEAGAEVFDVGIARDTGSHARDLFMRAIECADIVITSGGISMGRKDPFKNVFAELGITPVFYGITMKPGKPVFFAMYNNKPVFALPGNQVSTSVTFELLVRPFIRKALGLARSRVELELELTEPSINDSSRDFFKRGILETHAAKLMVKPFDSQESHMLTSLAGADILFRHPASTPELAAGAKVKCLFLKG
ncbi:MAG: molybdopterin molybdotransferase MoeA [Candidatus Riflebacteria bacterium]|nr:molybdopterin molybdotransferase MoeA [Candidatus Riflebacteria bacterium]